MRSDLVHDDSELLYVTMIGVVMAAIFATGFHSDVDRTITRFAPEGTSYPFPDQTRIHAAKFTAAIGGFLVGVFFWTVLGKLRWEAIRNLLKYRDWIYNPKSYLSKVWFLVLSTLIPRKRFLYTFQHVLPKYPLPTLQDSCQKILVTIEPLVTEDEFKEIRTEMAEFEKGEGIMLQKILEKRYDTEKNWVADLWDKYAYLVSRSPIVYTNFCVGGGLYKDDLSDVAAKSQSARAANYVFHHLKFFEMIEARTLPPLLVQNLVPICTNRYRYVFSTTRVPGQQMDELKTYESSKHIIVMRKGVMFRVEVYTADNNGTTSVLAPFELQQLFQSILNETKDLTEAQWNPAVFTGLDRTTWAQEREKLISHPLNKVSLHDVESAILHLSLDDSKPQNLKELSHSSMCGTGFNRWFDKSSTCVVHANGMVGGNIEHTTADATLTGRILEYVWRKGEYDEGGNAYSSDAPTHPTLPTPSRLQWDLKGFEENIPRYIANLDDFRKNIDLCALKLHHGKGIIKKLRVSPDSFIQMALQLTFYRMHKKVPKTYETAMTRFFKYGRTETIRTVSTHSVNFTKSMDDPSSSQVERTAHLKRAMEHHNNNKLDSMNGRGADRHFFGLYIAAKFAGIKPKIFNTPILTQFDQLSTSQSPYSFDPSLLKGFQIYPSGGAFAPQTDDGYGVYYLFLGENHMTVHITSYNSCPDTNSTKFSQVLQESMADMRSLLGKKGKSSSK